MKKYGNIKAEKLASVGFIFKSWILTPTNLSFNIFNSTIIINGAKKQSVIVVFYCLLTVAFIIRFTNETLLKIPLGRRQSTG